MSEREQQVDARQQEEAVLEMGEKGVSPASTAPTFGRDEVREEAIDRTNGTIDQKEGNTVKHLYRVTSKVNGLFFYGHLYDEVVVSWECAERDYPIMHPEQGIKDYHKQGCYRFYARNELNQLFAKEEAKALKEYLSRFKDITITIIERVDLPLPLEGLEICVKQDMDEDYRYRSILKLDGWDYDALPFEVAGYYHPRDGLERKPGLCRNCGNKLIEGQR